jgi:hypothetical protein
LEKVRRSWIADDDAELQGKPDAIKAELRREEKRETTCRAG